MLLDLPQTIEGSIYARRSEVFLHNYFNFGGRLLPRPAFHRWAEYNGSFGFGKATPGALIVCNSKLYAIHGSTSRVWNLTSIASADEAYPTALGYLGGGYPRSWAAGYTKVAIATSTETWVIDTAADTLTEITDLDLPDCRSVAYIDGRWVWVTDDGASVFFSAVGDPGDVEALDFFDAETSPDLNKEVAAIGNDLYIFGESTIERFRSTGDASTPFVRVANSVVSIGYRGAIIRSSDKVAFVGQEEGGPMAIYELRNGSITMISNDAVNEYLDLYTDPTNFSYNSGQAFVAYGRQVYTFSLSGSDTAENATIYGAFSDGVWKWGFFTDNINGFYGDNENWGIYPLDLAYSDFVRVLSMKNAIYFSGKWLFQSDNAGTTENNSAGVYALAGQAYSNGNKSIDIGDNNIPITKGFKMMFRNEGEKDLHLSALEIIYDKQGANRISTEGAPTGGDSGDTITLRVSKTGVGWGYVDDLNTNGKDWSDAETVIIGDKRDDHRAVFRKVGGILANGGYVGIVVETSAECPVVIEGVVAQI